MDIISNVASILPHLLAAWQASTVLSGEALAYQLTDRVIDMVHELIQMRFAIRIGSRYHRFRQQANTLHRLRTALLIIMMFWCPRRRVQIGQGFIATHSSKALSSGLFVMPVQNVLTTILHPIKYKAELLLQTAPVFGAANPGLTWVSSSVCIAANSLVRYPGFPVVTLLCCDPHRASRFTATLAFTILGE
jgi:hypothetical protein